MLAAPKEQPMDRYLLAYLIMAATVALAIGAFFYLRHHSRDRTYVRTRAKEVADNKARVEARRD